MSPTYGPQFGNPLELLLHFVKGQKGWPKMHDFYPIDIVGKRPKSHGTSDYGTAQWGYQSCHMSMPSKTEPGETQYVAPYFVGWAYIIRNKNFSKIKCITKQILSKLKVFRTMKDKNR